MSPHMHIPDCTCDLHLINWRKQVVIHVDPACRLYGESTPLDQTERTVVAAR